MKFEILEYLRLIFNPRKVFFTLQMLSQALFAKVLAVKMPRIHNFLKL